MNSNRRLKDTKAPQTEAMGEQDKLVFCGEFLTNLYSTNAKGY